MGKRSFSRKDGIKVPGQNWNVSFNVKLSPVPGSPNQTWLDQVSDEAEGPRLSRPLPTVPRGTTVATPRSTMPRTLPSRKLTPVPGDYHDHHKTRSLEPRKRKKNSFLVTFFKNGQPHFKGYITSISIKAFPKWEGLLGFLDEKVPMPGGVKHIYCLETGEEITDVEEFEDKQHYIVSSTLGIISALYGKSREQYWFNRKLSAGKVRKGEHKLFHETKKSQSDSESSPSRVSSIRSLPPPATTSFHKKRIFTIISNTNRNSYQKVILNPQTTQTFEEMLKDITGLVQMQNPPVRHLYTARPPFRQVRTFTQLLRDFASHQVFIACGGEGKPLDMTVGGRHHLNLRDAHTEEEVAKGPGRRKRQQEAKTEKPRPRRRPVRPRVMPQDDLSDNDSGPSADLVSDSSPRPSVRPMYHDVVQANIHGRLRDFYAPRHAEIANDGSRPTKRLHLEWVYGYRGRDGKNNLLMLPSGELLYHVAAVVVLFDQKQGTQKHYTGHNEDITCIALHPNRARPYVASGQAAGRDADNASHIRVWHAHSLETYAVIGTGVFHGGISSLCFSVATGESGDSGDLLLAVDDAGKHTLSVWDWSNDRLIAETTSTSDSVVWAAFHPQDHKTVVTFGKSHLHFWRFNWDPKKGTAGRLTRDKSSGIFENEELPRFVTSLAFSDHGDVITGDSSGRIIVWRKDNSGAYVMDKRCSDHLRRAHSKSVFALCMMSDGTLISGGGNTVKHWDAINYYQPVREHKIPEHTGYIHALAPAHKDRSEGPLYIGTTKNLILEGSYQEKCTYIVQGHSEELWGLAVHPDDSSFITAGYDQQVCKWSSVKHKLIWRVTVEQPCLSVAIDPAGQVVAIGTTVGRFIVLSCHNGMHITSVQVGMEQLDAISFSPDGTLLAMGSHDSCIYLYSVLDEGQVFRKYKQGSLKGHKNFVTHLDWSADSNCLRSVSGDYDLLFWNASELVQEDAETMRDISWATETAILGYNIHGAWSYPKVDEDLNTTDKSNDSTLIAVGDNVGHVRLYAHPCVVQKARHYEEKICSSHVTKVRFTAYDTALITTGGADASLLQWKLVDKNFR